MSQIRHLVDRNQFGSLEAKVTSRPSRELWGKMPLEKNVDFGGL